MSRLFFAAVLMSVLASCASPGTAPESPYGSPDGQRERAGQATRELDRSVGGK